MSVVTYPGDDSIGEVCTTMLEALRDALAASPGGLPTRLFLAPGSAVPWDTDQGWVRIAAIDQVVVENRGVGGKTFAWNLALELGVTRCVHTVQRVADQPVLPSGEDLTADAGIVIGDLRALRTVFDVISPYRRWQTLTSLGPMGPAGGLAAAIMLLRIRVADCAAELSAVPSAP